MWIFLSLLFFCVSSDWRWKIIWGIILILTILSFLH